jgi:hypothetical protein
MITHSRMENKKTRQHINEQCVVIGGVSDDDERRTTSAIYKGNNLIILKTSHTRQQHVCYY